MLRDEIGTPRTVLRVATPEAYEAWARRVRIALHRPGALRRSTTALPAHVSDGRWVVDCPCGGGALAEPEWTIGICADCGTIHPVTFPRDRAAIEEVLLARPNALNRHFMPAAAAEHRIATRAARAGVTPAVAEASENLARAAVGAEPIRAETLAALRRENQDHGLPLKREDT